MPVTTPTVRKPRPLEDRFTTLYDDIVHERKPGTDTIEEKRTPKAVPPTERDVIGAVLASHGVRDTSGIAADIIGSLKEFRREEKSDVKPKPPITTAKPASTKSLEEEDEE